MLPNKSENYRPDVDGLRALAVLPVVLFHANLGCPGGFVGVDVFYVISGYLISSIILKDLGEGVFTLANFWERRIRRILPALAVVVFTTLVAGWFLFVPEDFQALGGSVIAQAIFLSNVFFYHQGLAWGGYFTPAPLPQPLLHTWSLAVEEQFYLLFPGLLILLFSRGRPRLLEIITLLAAGSLLLSIYGSYVHHQATFYLLPTRAWELLVGVMLTLMRGRIALGNTVKEATGWLGFCLIGFAIFAYDENTRFPGLAALSPCLGAALVIVSSDARLSLPGRILAFKPLAFIGLISYSLYLWHWPLLVFSKFVCCEPQGVHLRIALVVASCVLAALTWKYIETPFRKRKVLRTSRSVFGFAGVCFVTLLLSGIAVSRSHGFPSRTSANTFVKYRESRNHFKYRDQISLQDALAEKYVKIGSQQAVGSPAVLVWGDSHAMAIAPVIDALCAKYSCSGRLAAFHATAPVLDYVSRGLYAEAENSPAVASAVTNFISREHVKTVIITAAWDVTKLYEPDDEFKSKLLKTIRAVMDSGARVYVVEDVPYPDFDVPSHVAFAALFHDDISKLGITQTEQVKRAQRLARTFDEISQMGATVLDPDKYFLNDKGIYGVWKNGDVLYFDGSHLTVEGANMLAPMFEPIFHNQLGDRS